MFYCVVSLSAAVAVASIQVLRCKEAHFEHIGRLGSLECATTVFEVSKLCHNKALIQKSKTIKIEIMSCCAHTVLSSA